MEHLDRLHPVFRPLARKILTHIASLATHAGCSWYVASSWRSPEKQLGLYKQGRLYRGGRWERIPGQRVVTNALPHETPHCITLKGKPSSCAIDVALTDGSSWLSDDDPRWGIIPAVAGIVDPSSLVSGAMWKSIRDWPHIELKNWREINAD